VAGRPGEPDQLGRIAARRSATLSARARQLTPEARRKRGTTDASTGACARSVGAGRPGSGADLRRDRNRRLDPLRPPRARARSARRRRQAASAVPHRARLPRARRRPVRPGDHGSWNDSGYHRSGAVSYALHGGGFINQPEDSGSLESWGVAGAGSWITVYTNSTHAYMVVAGLRFDTSSAGSPSTADDSGPR